jgi:hypothetical protein
MIVFNLTRQKSERAIVVPKVKLKSMGSKTSWHLISEIPPHYEYEHAGTSPQMEDDNIVHTSIHVFL